jgi:urease accessory protein
MFQPPAPIMPSAPLQRSRGSVRVTLKRRSGRARLGELYQSGCGKAFLPRVDGPEPEVVFLNTAGGLTGGDRLAYALGLDAGLRAVATTQTAERIYASAGGRAEVTVTLGVGDGARLDWLPQETIVFEAAALDRRTEIDLAGEAACLFAETIVLGRAAMGESVRRADLRDVRTVRRDGRPVFVEPLALGPAILAAAAEPALLRGARAFATVALVARGAEDAVAPVRRVLDEPGVEAAASGWDGRCVVRVLGPDGWPVRRQVARVLAVLRDRPLPRVWQL